MKSSEYLVSAKTHFGARYNLAQGGVPRRSIARLQPDLEYLFDYQPNADGVEARLAPRTRLVVLTNLHNPTAAYADAEALRRLAEAARIRP